MEVLSLESVSFEPVVEIGFGCAGEKTELLKAIKKGSIITWRHVDFYGEYDFSEEKLKDLIGFNLPEIVGWKMEEKREQTIPLKSIETKDYQKLYETLLPFGDF